MAPEMHTKALFPIYEHTSDGWRYANPVNSPYSYARSVALHSPFIREMVF
jgi:hypothetical protein